MWCTRQSERIHQRIIQKRKENALKYEIVDIDISEGNTYDERMRLIDDVLPGTSERLHHLLCEHYRKSTPLAWKLFLNAWIPRCTNFIMCYTTPLMMPEVYEGTTETSPFVCAIGMYTRKTFHIYGRILCSRCFVGMKIIEYLKHKYSESQYGYMTFHVDAKMAPLYKKHGAILTDMKYIDYMGATYSFMYLPFSRHIPHTYIQDNCSHFILHAYDIWFTLAVTTTLILMICILLYTCLS